MKALIFSLLILLTWGANGPKHVTLTKTHPFSSELDNPKHGSSGAGSHSTVTWHHLKVLAPAPIKVWIIFWGASQPNFATDLAFYQALIPSGFFGWANADYGFNKTGQTLAPGNVSGYVNYTNASTQPITDAVIQSGLNDLLSRGLIDQPAYNIYYAVHFADNVIWPSGTFGTAWCAYHNFYNISGQPLMYGVIPENAQLYKAGNTSCGSNINDKHSYTSHEAMEVATDPYWDPTATLGGWWARNNNEIGDNCNWIQCNVTINTNPYTIQKMWSNSANTCVCPTV